MRRNVIWLVAAICLLLWAGFAGPVSAALDQPAIRTPGSASTPAPAAGRFLVAGRKFLDPFFSRTVIWLLQHDAQASFGLIVNQAPEQELAGVVPGFGDSPLARFPVSHGGPVDRDLLVILLRSPEPPELARHVIADVYASINPQLLHGLPAGVGRDASLRLFSGHAGWTPGQLEAEVRRGDWHVVEGDPAIVFGDGTEDLWETLIRQFEPVPDDPLEIPRW